MFKEILFGVRAQAEVRGCLTGYFVPGCDGGGAWDLGIFVSSHVVVLGARAFWVLDDKSSILLLY